MSDYTAFFCEENIWRLASRMADVDACFVLLFFNSYGHVALCQQSAFGDEGIGLWDYHVVLLDTAEGLIHDFDTRLDKPSPAQRYLRSTFPDQQSLPLQYRAIVRCVPAREYLQRFSSDRSHMLDEYGVARATFPEWPLIASGNRITLQQYIGEQVIADSESVVMAIDCFDSERPLGG